MVCHLIHSVIRYISNLYPILRCRFQIHSIHADPVSHHIFKLRQCRHNLFRNIGILNDKYVCPGALFNHFIFCSGTCEFKFNPRIRQDFRLDINVFMIAVCNNHLHNQSPPISPNIPHLPGSPRRSDNRNTPMPKRHTVPSYLRRSPICGQESCP